MTYLILLLSFIALEIYLLIIVGGMMGAGYTLLWLIFAGFLGLTVLRVQGLTSIRRAWAGMSRGETLAQGIVETALGFVAGLLLIAPGLVSDILALIILLPPVRRALARRVLGRFTTRLRTPPPPDRPAAPPAQGRTLEGEAWREDR